MRPSFVRPPKTPARKSQGLAGSSLAIAGILLK
jgi:hypothetical protein